MVVRYHQGRGFQGVPGKRDRSGRNLNEDPDRTNPHMWKAVDIDAWGESRRSGFSRVKGPVEEIIRQVREGGDDAVRSLSEKFDHIRPDTLLVSEEDRQAAYDRVDTRLVESLIESEARIAQFHEMMRPEDLWLRQVAPGITLGMKTTPLDRIGAYIPGGRASYLSTALMCTVPARVAGVPSICCCSPPPIHPATLVALDIAGVEEIYQIGGAQAIAAMALGTESIRPVLKIVGPGNIYVTAAKVLLRESAEIDFPAGPSEIAIIADETADPEFIAADILAQAEHDPHAACILLTTDKKIMHETWTHIERMSKRASRRDIIEKALKNSGYFIADDIDGAISAANTIAPEHLSIQTTEPMHVLSRITNAGAIFIGPYAAVAFGDYSSGTNHVLPTAGYSRMYSGLDVMHFLKTSSVQLIEREGVELMGEIVETIAGAEGLSAHAESVRIRRMRP
jgi:histidinol dehydrogenase